ncbi:hypothetical protein EJ110_NYTH00019 [Nymphaea thermarum]|nr:hypothetical protein EJ110_NYTH00019 [Nymphaea thermarum]
MKDRSSKRSGAGLSSLHPANRVQKCDMCKICKTAIPRSGNIFRLRLYDQCVEAGLIPKEHADQFQQRGEKHSTVDVQRLYSLFDVAVENNLVTLICHYITDVCMDESAVSSDPVVAILLDEVVVTEWCKRVFKSILAYLLSKCILPTTRPWETLFFNYVYFHYCLNLSLYWYLM